ncbi:RNA polymerase sigma-70 factor [Leifsonia sp. Leaf264]|uniref:RNA polymerase sigma-70 factor n=1 Tax=Leifsonia sp. Leaf264 TaxID=1736314 RepID=UPI0006F2EC88|nr:RNA polymerase sigma-70 factor [Leifsonia sp. Leaf264]KQO96966.1 RNA polymerase subunit sigma-24 [Leifsonia sp. Leaf264]
MSDDPFLTHRRLLFTVAYEMLGSAADTEDVLQESWLRWSEVDASQVRDPRAYLVRVVTRQTLNHLRSQARRREDYIGEWLPEPLLTTPDVADDVELAESVSMAMLTVLETLVPTERAVFVLREVFDVPYEEIAEALGKEPSAVRQIAHRARDHVAARRPRVSVDATEQHRVVERFVAALNTGDLQGVLAVLAPDVVLVADGNGLIGAARKPIVGAEMLATYLVNGAARVRFVGVPVSLNATSGALFDVNGELAAAVSMVVVDGLITRLYSVVNPDKLARLDAAVTLTR